MRYSILSLAVLGFGLSSAPAFADSVLFSDLGPSDNAYSTQSIAYIGGWAESSPASGVAMPFVVAGSGDEAVSQIDLAITYLSGYGTNTFTASIWTGYDITFRQDSYSGGQFESQVAGAFWSLSTTAPLGTCCSLVTVPVSGVTLFGGTQYWLVLQPVDYNDNSLTFWSQNNQGALGLTLSSQDGVGWGTAFSDQLFPLAAFDVLGVPEPASILLSATGLAALLALCRRKAKL